MSFLGGLSNGIKRKLSGSSSYSRDGSDGGGEGASNQKIISAPRYIPQSLEYYMSKTHFSKPELQSLYRNFKNDCPNGILNEEVFVRIYAALFPAGDARNYSHFVFRAFDTYNVGQITFEQFIVGLSTWLRGTFEEQLRWIFRLYDINDQGFLTKEEMLTLIKSIHKLLGADMSENYCRNQVDKLFQKFEPDDKGAITMQEFSEKCTKDATIVLSMGVFDRVI